MTEETPVIKELPVIKETSAAEEISETEETSATEETSVMEEMPVMVFDASEENEVDASEKNEIDASEKDFEDDTRNRWIKGDFIIHVHDQRTLTPEELDQCAQLWLLTSGRDDFPQKGEIFLAVSPVHPRCGKSHNMQDPSAVSGGTQT